MGRSPNCQSCSKHEDLNRGAWTASEDKILSEYITTHGVGQWRALPKNAGLKRSGKSCRMRWLNYLRPDIKRGNISPEEEDLLIRLHRLLGNRWALMARLLPGRTDNEIKNYWHTHLSKRVQVGKFQPKFKKPFERSDVRSYCNYDEEGVVHKDISTSQNTPIKPSAVRYSGRAVADVDILDCYNYDHVYLDSHDGINQEGLKTADDNVVEIDTSKSWCQLLLEDCMGDYQYDQMQPDSMISTSCGTDDYHQSPSPSLSRSITLHESHSSSCNFFDQEFSHSKDFNSSYFDFLIASFGLVVSLFLYSIVT